MGSLILSDASYFVNWTIIWKLTVTKSVQHLSECPFKNSMAGIYHFPEFVSVRNCWLINNSLSFQNTFEVTHTHIHTHKRAWGQREPQCSSTLFIEGGAQTLLNDLYCPSLLIERQLKFPSSQAVRQVPTHTVTFSQPSFKLSPCLPGAMFDVIPHKHTHMWLH